MVLAGNNAFVTSQGGVGEMLLAGKNALVTGAGQGIGRAIALTLAEQGANVAINDIAESRASEVAGEVTAVGRKGIAIVGDVSSASDVKAMFAKTAQEFGRIDIVVNNAGIILKNAFWEITEAEWEKIMAINLKGVFLCCQAAAEYMRPQKSGKIINIASIAGKRGGGVLGNTAYAASKGGVLGLTKGLARELGPYGINVNAITPGLTETEMTQSISPEKKEFVVKSIALGRPGKPQDIANAAVFLASSLSDFISGEMMDVDGGFMMD